MYLILQLPSWCSRVSQEGKMFTSYSSQLLYYRWLSHLLPFYLEQKAPHAENVLRRTVFNSYSGRCPYPVWLLYPSRLFYYRWFSPFCLQYLMQRRVLPMKVYTSEYSVYLLELRAAGINCGSIWISAQNAAPNLTYLSTHRHTYTHLQHYNCVTFTQVHTRFLSICCRGEIIYFRLAPSW